MKKVLLFAMFAVTMQLLHAQDMKKVQTVFVLKKYDDAKTEIDKVMADPKLNTKPDALYWKARVYSTLYKDTVLRAKYPTVGKEAEAAMQAYIAADPAFAQVKEKGAEPFFDMQSVVFNEGIKSFNKKDWENAAANFKASVDYSDIMFKNKWANTTMAFDTTSILYQAYAYQNWSRKDEKNIDQAKQDEAMKLYTRLADAKVVSVNGDSMEDIYKFIVDYYSRKKDEANFRKYLGEAKTLFAKFPTEEFEVDYLDNNLTTAQKVAQFDKDNATGTLSDQMYLVYGDMFVHAKDKEKEKGNTLDSATIVTYNLKGAEAFKKAYALNNQNAIAAFNVGIIYYNIYNEYGDRYAANIRAMQAVNSANADKPVEKDPKKKAAAEAALKAKLEPFKAANAELEKPMIENMDIAVEWLEKSYTTLKDKQNRTNVEKNVINKTVDFLANLYAYKRDKLKGKDPKAFDAYDAKYKMYDDLHGKF